MKHSDLLAIWHTLFPPPLTAEQQAQCDKRYAKTPVSFWHKPAPVAAVPKNKQSNVVELNTDTYTEAEIMAMTDDEFRIKLGAIGIQTRRSAIKDIQKRNRGNAKEIEL